MSDEWLWDGSPPPDPEDDKLTVLATLRRDRVCPELPVRGSVAAWGGGAEPPRNAPPGVVEDLASRRARRIVRLGVGAGLALLAAAVVAAVFVPRGWDVRVLEGDRPCWIGPCGMGRGDALVTGAGDTWEVDVGEIGVMRLTGDTSIRRLTTEEGYLLRLDAGAIEVAVNAPPRMLRVETPAAVVVDLGCAYGLAATAEETRLVVRSGTVALENDFGVSVVPAGSTARAQRGQAPALPLRADAPAGFVEAVAGLERALAGSAAGSGTLADPLVDAVLAAARPEDGFTLWHVLQRVPEGARARVFDGLAARVPGVLPTDRDAVLALDAGALRLLWKDLAVVAYSEG